MLRVEAPIPEVAALGAQAVALDPKQVAQQRAALQAEVKGYLERVKARLETKGVKVRTQMREGSPASEIIDFAQENAVDLIAMSTHGHSGLSRWVLGSVSDKVLHGTESPLLIVRPRGKA